MWAAKAAVRSKKPEVRRKFEVIGEICGKTGSSGASPHLGVICRLIQK